MFFGFSSTSRTTLTGMGVLCCASCALRCIVVCCSVLQCGAVCFSVFQRVAVCCSVLQFIAVSCSALQCVAVCTSISSLRVEQPQQVWVCCAVHRVSCSALQ